MRSMIAVTATQLHDRTAELIQRAMRAPQRPILIHRHGKPAIVLVNARYFESLIETLDILSDRQTAAKLWQGMADLEAGRVISHQQLGEEMGLLETKAARH